MTDETHRVIDLEMAAAIESRNRKAAANVLTDLEQRQAAE